MPIIAERLARLAASTPEEALAYADTLPDERTFSLLSLEQCFLARFWADVYDEEVVYTGTHWWIRGSEVDPGAPRPPVWARLFLFLVERTPDYRISMPAIRAALGRIRAGLEDRHD